MAKSNLTIEVERLKKEFYQGMAELKESQKKADEESRESEKKREKWREEWNKGMAELRESQRKTDEQMKKTEESQRKTDEQMKETDEEMKKTDKRIRQVTDGFGKFTEGLVEPNVLPLFKELGIKITGTGTRVKRHYNGETMEVDILATGRMNKRENVIIFIEAKTDPTQRDIKDEIKHIGEFSKFFNEYRGRCVIGAIAGIKIAKGVKEYAQKRGFYVLAPSGDTMAILNKKEFKPRIWR